MTHRFVLGSNRRSASGSARVKTSGARGDAFGLRDFMARCS
jgi:hypothetical protein